MAFIARVGATGFPAPGDMVSVYAAGTTDIVSGLIDLDGTALSNPLTIPAAGFWGFTPPTRNQVDVFWHEGARNLVEKAIVKDPDSPAEVGMSDVVQQIAARDGSLAADVMGFLTNGTSFAPLIEVDGSPSVLWTFADGTTSTDLHPTKDYGSHAEERVTTLKVTPWSALKIINLGFAAADGGTTANGLDLHDTQPVIDVQHLYLAAPSLEHWAACGCNIDTLIFDDFVLLEEMEMYGSTGLEHLSFKNCPALYRVCFENCNVYDYVNFSDVPLLADVRGANNNYYGPIFNESLGAPNLWHLCIRSNPQFDRALPYDQMPLMRDLFLWDNGHTGHIEPNSTVGTSFQLSGCNFTSGTFNGVFAGSTGTLDISDNPSLAALSVPNNPSLGTLDASGCALPQADIDQILVDLVAAGRTNGSVDLTGGTNAEATLATGQPAIDTLVSRGWSVSCAIEATPQAILTANAVDFGDIGGVSAQMTITVSNTGSIATTPGAATLSDLVNFTIISDAVSGAEIIAGGSADIVVEFNGTTGDFDETLSIAYDASAGVAASPLVIEVDADDTAAASNVIQFTTTAQTCDCAVEADGATITWTFADGTTVVGADPGAHDFGSAGERTENYITIDPPEALTRINFNGSYSNVSEIHGLPNFPMLNFVFVYQNTDFHLADFTGLSELRDMHMNSSGMAAAEVDAMFIAVATATPSTVSDATFYASLPRTSASDAAVAALTAAGWNMNI